ncbi:PE-PPE domain-containing protein [Mycobacterium sp.]|uniref:PE family protein n=1 Tax=Mycobacterium sp. TaxID=1785 RepID=UPI002C24BA98|nr:PE-PPE domain-containing protein [Mycobacterium sp.]HTQ20852.1 PE-PPE domain-containing protein [Mycobacterium sp.]
MSELFTDGAALAQAASEVAGISTPLREATLAAAASTSTVLPPGADEVSAAITTLVNGHAQEYQQIAAGAQRFHEQFAGLLAQSGQTYQQTEQAAEQFLRDIVTELEQPFTPFLVPPETPTPPTVPSDSSVGLILGGTDSPFASKNWAAGPLYLNGSVNSLLYTPEQFWPITPQLGGMTLGQSVHEGVGLLDQALLTQFAAGNHVTVWTMSQSSVVATEEIRSLMAQGSPYTGQLSFVLTGNPNNPNGGFFERFTGLYIPLLDADLNGATPPDSPYATSVYTNQYDGVADFPNYPLNVVSDVNAILGATPSSQHNYIVPRTYYELPTSPDYHGHTTYYMSLDDGLPLTQPLRLLGGPGNAVADLLQPDLRVIVDLGYASGQYADIPTPAQLVGIPNVPVVLNALATGTVQGVQAFGVDAGLLPQSMFPDAYPYLPVLDPGLNLATGQPSVTAISLVLGAEHRLMDNLGLIPSWD